MMSSTCRFIVVLLLFAFRLLLCLLRHLAVITFTVHASRVREWRNKQRKSNKK